MNRDKLRKVANREIARKERERAARARVAETAEDSNERKRAQAAIGRIESTLESAAQNGELKVSVFTFEGKSEVCVRGDLPLAAGLVYQHCLEEHSDLKLVLERGGEKQDAEGCCWGQYYWHIVLSWE